MDLKIEKGVALVIVGPQACGKTTLARELAAKLGTFDEIEALHLQDGHANFWRPILQRQPKTLIVDGLPTTPEATALAKQMLTSATCVIANGKSGPVEVPSPNLVFTTSDEAAAAAFFGRRYRVVDIGKNAHAA